MCLTQQEKYEGNDTESDIPLKVWNIIPPRGLYLKNIMKFSGYDRRESILKLKSKDEIGKMFDFAKSMCDLVDNKDSLFGIFSRNRDKVMIMPGLEVSYEYFYLMQFQRF